MKNVKKEIMDMYKNSEYIDDGGSIYNFIKDLSFENFSYGLERIVKNILMSIIENTPFDKKDYKLTLKKEFHDNYIFPDEEELQEFKDNIIYELDEEFHHEPNILKFIKNIIEEILDESIITERAKSFKTFKQFLREYIVQDNQQADINDKLMEYSKSLTNYNSVNLSQIKNILNQYGLILINSDGTEVQEDNITLTDNENTKTYGVASRTDTKDDQLGEGQERYNNTENVRLSIRRNKDEAGNLSVLISLNDFLGE